MRLRAKRSKRRENCVRLISPIPIARFLALTAVCILGAACGNNPHPKPLRETRPDGSRWVVFQTRLPDDPRTLDPQVSYDTLGNAVIANIYEGLLQYDPFKTDPYEVVPCLAETLPRHIVNPDGTESYEVQLKRGIFFHDDPCFPGGKGRELTAQDFVYTFQRIADPAVECPVFSNLQEYIAGLREAYLEAKKAGRFDYSKPIAAITVLDSHRFRIEMRKPYPQLLYWLAMAFTAPVPREAVEHYDGREGRPQFKFHPVGTGPYRLAEWSRSRLLRLARHERYSATRFPAGGWRAEENNRFSPMAVAALPFVDEVQMTVIRENIPAWLLFRQGYLDRSGVAKDVFSSVVTGQQTLTGKYRDRGVQLFKDVDPSTFYLVFNMEDPVVGANRKLRQAISMAYDWERANEIFSNGVNIKAEQLLPPGVAGHQTGFYNPYRVFNLAAARKLLAEAGYPDGRDPRTGQPLTLTLDVIADDAESRQYAEFQQGQIAQLGINCRIEENTWARFQDKQDRGAFQVNGGSGWSADYPDPENFFFLFYSKNIPPRGSNHARYSNPEFDRVFQRMSTMENGPERLELIHRLNAILVEDCPIMLMSHSVSFSLSQPWIPRVSRNPLLAGGIKYVRLDPELREAKRHEWNHVILWPLWVTGGVLLGAVAFGVNWARKRTV